MKDILTLTQFKLLKILLLESYQQKYNQYSKITSNELYPPKSCLKDFWALFNPEESQHSFLPSQPSQWKSIHAVFHISPLEPVKTATIANRHKEPPPPIIIEGEEEWEISQILDSKLKRGKLSYLVEWRGFSQHPEGSIWEPAESRKHFPELVKKFYSLHPDKPGPKSSRA
ncbi:hypothetical protein O181_014558 [Austropuccinia psidii MF-1]|uniref:Chromo domain-containing protein n=1 Tax=Austropuccinia psidii MF-1 TaxID=1389203 RepID=A0A9Q3C0S2_9BASI|nr:hypothetical protein [Austropuccinia psidii MF-1]